MGWKRPEHLDTKEARRQILGHSMYDFHWLSPDGYFTNQIPNYSTDASADYLILEKVQETWNNASLIKFESMLEELLGSRGFVQAMNYHKGDYLKSAFMALNEELNDRI